jgi:hypothetical protein
MIYHAVMHVFYTYLPEDEKSANTNRDTAMVAVVLEAMVSAG